jgi:MinD-like ATPase involved in chromosome partitioning or flagellar assembly
MLKDKLLARREATRNEAADLNSKLVRIGAIVAEQTRLAELLRETKRALDEVLVENQNDLSRAVEIIARGKVPDGAIEDKRKPAALGAAVFGGLGSFAIVILGTLLGGRLRFSDDLDSRSSGLLAAVSPEECGSAQALAAMRKLRNEFDLRWPSGSTEPFVIGVLGTQPGAGATRMSAALGMTYAAAGRKVLLVDADPAGNGLSRLHAVEQGPGLVAVAQGRTTLAAAVSLLAADGGALHLLAAPRSVGGAGIDGAAPELAVDGMRRLLHAARADHDVIVLDLGALAAGAQSAVGAALAERVLLVTACGTRRQFFDAAMALLDRLAPERFLVVLNRALPTDPAVAHAAPATDSRPAQPHDWLAQSIRYMKRRPEHE